MGVGVTLGNYLAGRWSEFIDPLSESALARCLRKAERIVSTLWKKPYPFKHGDASFNGLASSTTVKQSRAVLVTLSDAGSKAMLQSCNSVH